MSYAIIKDMDECDKIRYDKGRAVVHINGSKLKIDEILEISDCDKELRLIKAISLNPKTMEYNGGNIYFVGSINSKAITGAKLYKKNNKDSDRLYLLSTDLAWQRFKRHIGRSVAGDKKRLEEIDSKEATVNKCETLEEYIEKLEKGL
jgi:hypothetical protein